MVGAKLVPALNRKGDVAMGDSDPNTQPAPVQPVGASGPAGTGTGRIVSVSPEPLLSGVNW